MSDKKQRLFLFHKNDDNSPGKKSGNVLISSQGFPVDNKSILMGIVYPLKCKDF